MIKLIGVRLLQTVPVLLVLSVLVFALSHAGGGDPITNQNSVLKTISDEDVAAIRAQYGLDRPVVVQYTDWLGKFVVGDWGNSISLKVPVFDVIWPAFVNTLILTFAAVLICVVLGVLIGFVTGLRKGTLLDRVTMLFAQIANNLPVYWLGLMLIWIFAIQLKWLPTSGMYDVREGETFSGLLAHLVLPAFSAAVISMLILARLTRSTVVDALGSDYVRTYRSQGVPRWRIIRRHIGRNSLLPIINMTGLQIGFLIGGVIFVESVFAWPGVGSQLYGAIATQDFPVIQSGVMLVAASFLIINLATDVTLDLLNPRVRRP